MPDIQTNKKFTLLCLYTTISIRVR